MMAKITNVIPISKIEIIRDRIGAILAAEINNQYSLTNDTDLNLLVWQERAVAFDTTELPAINIYFDSASEIEKTLKLSKYQLKYNIEILANSTSTSSGDGDKLAALKVHKIIRIIRYILEHPYYLTLDFSRGSISKTNIDQISIVPPVSQNDGTYTSSAQINFNVEVMEENGNILAIKAKEITTEIEIDESGKGYFFTN